MYRLKDVDWFRATKNVDDDLHTDFQFVEVSVNDFKHLYGTTHNIASIVHKNDVTEVFYSIKETRKVCDSIIEKIKVKPRFYLSSKVLEKSKILSDAFQGVSVENFRNLELQSLLDLYKSQYNKHKDLYLYAWAIETLQSKVYNLDEQIISIISNTSLNISDLNRILVDDFPIKTSIYKEQILDYLEICNQDNMELLVKHYEKYKYLLYHGYRNPKIVNLDEYLAYMREITDMKFNISKNFISLRKYKDEFDIDTYNLLSEYLCFGIVKSVRRLAELKNFYFLDNLLKEIASRMKVHIDLLRVMIPEEIYHIKSQDFSGLNLRKKGVFYVKIFDYEVILPYDNFEKLKDYFTKTKIESVQLRGKGNNFGKVYGVAVRLEDVSKVNLKEINSILVVYEGDPDHLRYLYDSIGLISEQGGVTSHLSVICNELEIPYVCGVENLTKTIETGDYIVIDSLTGIIKRKEQKKWKL